MSALAEKARLLLCNRPRTLTYEVIAKDIGVSVKWLEMFAAGKVPNGGVAKVEALFNRLSEKALSELIG